jgi:hypothetical protein
VYTASNPVQHQRTKHVEIDLHFVRDKVLLGEIKVLHVPSSSQLADVFTKGLPITLFRVQRQPAHPPGSRLRGAVSQDFTVATVFHMHRIQYYSVM